MKLAYHPMVWSNIPRTHPRSHLQCLGRLEGVLALEEMKMKIRCKIHEDTVSDTCSKPYPSLAILRELVMSSRTEPKPSIYRLTFCTKPRAIWTCPIMASGVHLMSKSKLGMTYV